MKIEAIPNKGPASMGPEIDRNLVWADKVNIASAFVTKSALNHVEQALSCAKKENRALRIRLLFGLYQRFTPPDALSKMLALQKAYPGRFHVRIARNSRFHWKLYSFRKGKSVHLYIGSANLTKDGLMSSGELSIRILAKATDEICGSLDAEFDELWHDRALTLNLDILSRYKKIKRPAIIPHEDDAISGLLEKAERLPSTRAVTCPNPRVVFIKENLLDDTEEVIESETVWAKKNWDYMCNVKWWHDIIVSARVFLYVTWYDDPKEYWIEFRRVEETAELNTPDGKYFIAHSKLPHGCRRKYSDVKQELKKVGLTWEEIMLSKHLNKKQLQAACRLLRVKPDVLLQNT